MDDLYRAPFFTRTTVVDEAKIVLSRGIRLWIEDHELA
jgi:hypothetical protein